MLPVPVASSKVWMASLQLVWLSSGSHVSPEASQQQTKTWGQLQRILNLSSSFTSCSRAPSGVNTGGAVGGLALEGCLATEAGA